MISAKQIVSKALATNTWSQVSKNGLSLLRSPLLESFDDLVHAFTTRLGGNTEPPYEHFNLGRHVKDTAVQEDAVRNREMLCRSLNLDFEKVAIPGQVHSPTVKVVELDRERPEMKAVDGLVTGSQNLPLMLHFADCVPVIVYDSARHKAGIFHAGWRGTASKIVTVGVELMISEYGSSSKDMVAAVGPAIGRCCYPTGEDVYQALRTTVDYPEELFGELEGQKCPDLKAINAMQLMEAGVKEVDVSDWCTACAPELFYSHRQSGGVTGRQAALVSLD